MQHPGYPIDLFLQILETEDSIPKLSIKEFNYKKEKEKEKNKSEKLENRFVYACCLKGLSEPGEKAYYHISKGEHDPLLKERQQEEKTWM